MADSAIRLDSVDCREVHPWWLECQAEDRAVTSVHGRPADRRRTGLFLKHATLRRVLTIHERRR